MEYAFNVSVGYYKYLSGGVKAWDLLIPKSVGLVAGDTVRVTEIDSLGVPTGRGTTGVVRFNGSDDLLVSTSEKPLHWIINLVNSDI